MALKVKGIVDGGMHVEKALSRSSRFKPLHFSLSPPHRLMRVLGAVVRPYSLLMRAAQAKMPKRGSVRAQPVGRQ